ncbi:MAG TPA: NAD(P)-dependent oxidoreductase [Saprospiraceae bacterium]|nr:NAD(P)-dependent oxidoreductase [Saprospiraceae bacterium]
MKIGLLISHKNTEILQNSIYQEFPDCTFYSLPDLFDEKNIDVLIVWKYTPGSLKYFKNLKLICSYGAGVDHLLADPDLPAHVPVTRFVDRTLASAMTRYILMCITHEEFRFPKMKYNQGIKKWDPEVTNDRNINIGIMGLGALGMHTALTLHHLNYQVYGWCKHIKVNTPFKVYTEEHLQDFLHRVNIIACLLPLTNDTFEILNHSLFRELKKGSILINVGRGEHVNVDDLLAAIADQTLSSVWLDVFTEEPLPEDSPMWNIPEITITPHIASITDQMALGKQVAMNMKRLASGESLRYLVNKDLGY